MRSVRPFSPRSGERSRNTSPFHSVSTSASLTETVLSGGRNWGSTKVYRSLEPYVDWRNRRKDSASCCRQWRSSGSGFHHLGCNSSLLGTARRTRAFESRANSWGSLPGWYLRAFVVTSPGCYLCSTSSFWPPSMRDWGSRSSKPWQQLGRGLRRRSVGSPSLSSTAKQGFWCPPGNPERSPPQFNGY